VWAAEQLHVLSELPARVANVCPHALRFMQWPPCRLVLHHHLSQQQRNQKRLDETYGANIVQTLEGLACVKCKMRAACVRLLVMNDCCIGVFQVASKPAASSNRAA
jgi:hypothetical protein